MAESEPEQGQGYLHSRPLMAEVMKELLCPLPGASAYPRPQLAAQGNWQGDSNSA